MPPIYFVFLSDARLNYRLEARFRDLLKKLKKVGMVVATAGLRIALCRWL